MAQMMDIEDHDHDHPTTIMMVNNNRNNNNQNNDNHNNNYNDNSTNHMLDLIQNQFDWNTTTATNRLPTTNPNSTNIITATTSSTTTTIKFHVLNATEDIRNFLLNQNFDNTGFATPYHNDFDLDNLTANDSSLANQDLGTTTTTTDDWWDHWINTKPFPSGYSQLSIVLLAFFLSCIIILVVVGNLLVCIAIATEKSLKPVQNWFIASLAVSDLLIGLIIMPFSLARELMGYWMFGQVWCDIHAALDVLLCTASINSLFLISLDRYWSITQAVKYLKKRTPSRAAMMIAFVWIFSAFVSLPPLVGLKKAEQSNEYPQCNLSDDPAYVLYSSIGSFYFPALMMVFVYAKIFIAARSRARKHIAKKRFKIPSNISGSNNNNNNNNDALKEKSTTTTLCTSFSNPSPPEKNINIIINSSNTTMATGNQDNVDVDVVDDDYDDSNEITKDDSSHENELKKQILMLETSNHHHSSIQIMPEELEFQMECKRISVDVVDNDDDDDDGDDGDADEDEDNETVKMLKPTTTITAITPQIIIETSSESRRQSWNIISTSEIISTININQNPNSSRSIEGGASGGGGGVGVGGGLNENVSLPIPNIPANAASKNSNENDVNDQCTKRTYFSKAKYKHFKFKAPKINGLSKNLSNKMMKSKSSSSASQNNNNTTIDDDSDTADSPTNKDSAGCETKSFLSAPKLLRSRFGSTMSIADYDDSDAIDDEHNNNNNNNNSNNNTNNNNNNTTNNGSKSSVGVGGGANKKKNSSKNRVQYQDQQLIHLPSDAERHKRKIAKARERRATLIVGLIMAAFITAWLPFFVLYVLVALCQQCKESIPEGVFAVAFWLGYGNSAANPIIYTIFNRDYRKAFRKILFKR